MPVNGGGAQDILDALAVLSGTVNDIPAEVINTMVTPSDNLKVSADTLQVIVSQGTFIKKKEIQFMYDGFVRVYFELRGTLGGTQSAVATIYINGVSVGTQRQNGNATFTGYTEDIPINKLDKLQLYMKCGTDASATGEVKNFRVSYDFIEAPVVLKD